MQLIRVIGRSLWLDHGRRLCRLLRHVGRWLIEACSNVSARKKGHYKKSQRGYISPIWGEFPTQPNSTKIRIRIGVADIINHTKFDNDRPREYEVTEGRILACSI